MGGYLLFWKDIPGKDQAWYDSWQQILSPRKLHQEIDCTFFGVETSLFTDDMIVKIQSHSNKIKPKNTNYMYTCPSGYIARGTFFSTIKKNHNYLIGADIAKGRGQDYTVIEILDYENLNQVFELRDNHIQHDDFVKTLNNLCLTFIKNGANILISIESNMTGSAVINDLIAYNPMYKILIYKNTIGVDSNKTSSTNSMVPYFNCKYGVEITTGTRDLLINYIFNYIDKNIECINSKELINEIESLEIGRDGKIAGNPHDDTVFALGHCLLVKNRGRIQNILSIFNSNNDIRNDPTYRQQMQLSLANVSDDVINEITGANSDSLYYERVGLMETAAQMNPHNNVDNINESNINALQLLSGTNTLRMDYNGNIDRNSIDQMRQNLIAQTRLIQMQHTLPPIINNNFSNNKKSKRKKTKEIHYYSDDSNNMFTNDEDHAIDWIQHIM